MEKTKLSAEQRYLYITLYIHKLYWILTKLYTHTHKLIYLVQHLEYLLVPGMKKVLAL